MYQLLFALGYYGLMRVGELTNSQHVVKAANVHSAMNKNKILIILYSSKTHNEGSIPQKIKITSNDHERDYKERKARHFCPFQLLRNYMELRGGIIDMSEQLFIHRDRAPVTAEQCRKVLKSALINLGLDCTLYGVHSLRIGRTTDLIKFNYSLDEVRRAGHWRSNVVYKYIRKFVLFINRSLLTLQMSKLVHWKSYGS